MKKKLIVFLLILSLIFSLTYSGFKVKAEGETEEPIVEDVIETQTNEETEDKKINEPTKAQVWFQENLGWIVGIPTGTLIYALIEILILAKKSKQKLAELKETRDFNKYAKEQVELGNEMYRKSQELFVACKETIVIIEASITELDDRLTTKVNDIARRFDTTDNLIGETKATFEQLNSIIYANKEQIVKLQKAFLLVSTHTQELVANSTAEQIVELVEGNN